MKIWKKVLCSLLVVVLCLTSVPLSGFVGLELLNSFKASANAYMCEYKGNVFYYEELNNGDYDYIRVFQVDIYEPNLEFPSYISGIPVRIIDRNLSVSGFENVTSLTIPGTIWKIPEFTFYSFVNLEKAVLEEGVGIIERSAFDSCINLKSVDLPQSLDVLWAEAFYGCKSLEKIIVRNDRTEFYKGVGMGFPTSTVTLYGHENSTAQEIAETIGAKFELLNCNHTTIDLIHKKPTCSEDGYEAGKLCYKCGTWVQGGKKLEAYGHDFIVTAPAEPGSMYEYGYSEELTCNTCGCVEKEKIIPTIIYDEDPFLKGYANPENQVVFVFDLLGGTINQPVSVFFPEIGEFMVVNGVQRGYVSMPQNEVNQVVGQYFQLPNLVSPPAEGWKFIGWGCLKDGSIYNGNFKISEDLAGEVVYFSATYIDEKSYSGRPGQCYDLAEGGRYVSGFGNMSYLYDDGTLVVKGKNSIIKEMFAYNDKIKNILFMDGITAIDDYAFGECSNLESVVFPDSLNKIGYGTFGNCTKLETITMSNKVTDIDTGAFYTCNNLKDVYYYGTKEQWSNINIKEYNESLINATIHFLGEKTECDHSLVEHITPATCTKDGVRFFVCSKCDEIIGDLEPIPSAGHSYVVTGETDPTCTAQGFTTYTCECGDTYNSDYTDKLDHNYASEITTPTTHLKEGVITYTCECGDSYTESIEKITDHTYEKTVTTPTCTAQGFTTYTCECGDTYNSDYTDILEHDFVNWTSNNDGTHTSECSRKNCDHTEINDCIFSAWQVTEYGESRICIDCGHKETRINTDDGDIEIDTPENPEEDFEADEVEPNESNYILVQEAFEENHEGDYEILKAFDINLKNKDGVHVQPNGKVKVKLPLDSEKEGIYKVYRVNDDGTLTDMNAYRQGSHMVFETDHFSLYVIVDESEKPIPENPSDNCSCSCHKNGIAKFFFKFILFFQRIFKANKTCKCGINHY